MELPPGTFPTLYNNEKGYIDTYLSAFPGYYRTGDAGFYDDDGYLYVMTSLELS